MTDDEFFRHLFPLIGYQELVKDTTGRNFNLRILVKYVGTI